MAKSKAKVEATEVTIPEEDYEELLRESELLTALIHEGVEDWEGYELAVEAIKSAEEDED